MTLKKKTQCLLDGKRLLDSLHVPFCLLHGTALGFRREGSFIEHDFDIDVGVFEKDFNELLLSTFQGSGKFEERFMAKIDDQYMELSFRHLETRVPFDIFFIFDHPVKREHKFTVLWDFNGKYGSGAGNPLLLDYPDNINTSEIEFRGEIYQCADEAYLTLSYGDWKTPIDYTKVGKSPYLSTLNTSFRRNLMTVQESQQILLQKFGTLSEKRT